jgi:hypothetical protein
MVAAVFWLRLYWGEPQAVWLWHDILGFATP